MPYDEGLAERIQGVLGDQAVEHRFPTIFDGLSFLSPGNMACSVIKDELMVRIGPDSHDASAGKPAARMMGFTGRPMQGSILVAHGDITSRAALEERVERGNSFAASLPAK